MNADPAARSREVLSLCDALGFARSGICAASQTRHAEHVRRWIGEGMHGEMEWFTEELAARLDPTVLVPGAASIIVVADLYAARGGSAASEPRVANLGRIARYARGRDYHGIIKHRLHRLNDTLRERFPGHVFRTTVDSAPTLEREHAERAGLGWIAKDTMLIDPDIGSYTLLGATVTTLELSPTGETSRVPDACGSCTRCIDACPTGAISPYRVDAARCISYLTIEHRSPIDPSLHRAMGDWIFGCDVCQEVCPHNSAQGRGRAGRKPNAAYMPRRKGFDLLELLGWDEGARREAFSTSAMKRATLAMFKRNAIIAISNQVAEGVMGGAQREAAIARLRVAAADTSEDELVRVTARQVLASLDAPRPSESGAGSG